MCRFFSFVTNPDQDRDFYYYDWKMRKADKEGADSHSHICAHFKLNEDKCNKYEYNPLTKVFEVDMQNAEKDDRRRAKRWVQNLDWKLIVDPLIIKPIINPFKLPKVSEPTEEQIGWLKELYAVWYAVLDSVEDSVWYAVWYAVLDSVEDSVEDSVGDAVWYAVRDAVWYAVGCAVRDAVGYAVRDAVVGYISSFFNIEYKYDFLSAVKLWEAGLVPSFDGTTWRLHSGKDADIVYEWTPEGA